MPHQLRLMRRLLVSRYLIAAHDVGLGKSMSAAVAASALHRHDGASIVVVSPAAAYGAWHREFDVLGAPFTWASVDAERLPRISGRTVVICDEAQAVRNLSALRTRRFLDFVRQPDAQWRWLLTATPMHNGDARNLFALLAALDHELAVSYAFFDNEFAPSKMRQKDYDDLWDSVAGVIDVCTHGQVPEMPVKQRAHVDMPLTKWGRQFYSASVDRAKERYRELVATGQAAVNGQALAIMASMRKAGSIAKTPVASDWLDAHPNQPVFTFSPEAAGIMHEAHGGLLLTGQTTGPQRRRLQDAYNLGGTNIFLTTRAGGASLSLSAARESLLVDRELAVGDTHQAEGRIVRLSSVCKRPVVHWLASTELDERIDEINKEKEGRVIAMFGGMALKEADDDGNVAQRILKSMFG